MNTPNHNWTASLPKENPDLFRLIYDFNYRPAYWVHPSRSASLPHADLSTVLVEKGASLKQMNNWVASKLEIQNLQACWDFSDPRQRLALLRHETLATLAIFCGAALRWSRIATIIGRAQIVELKGAIGEHAHAFALRRGRQVVDQETASQKLPDQTLNQEIHQLGWTTVLTALGGEAAALLNRFVLKLPESIPQPDFASVSPEMRDGAWQKVRKVLAEVLTREEMKCFA